MARYERTRADVKLAVDETDPLGLLALGAPNDEYDDIVERLVSMAMHNDEITTTSLSTWIRDRYGLEPSLATLVETAKAIQIHVHSGKRDPPPSQ